MKPWTLYILECADGTLYTGITTDPQRRLDEHNAGVGARYTRARLPVTMVYQTSAKDRSEASRLEYRIKKLPRKAKLEMIKAGKTDHGKTGDR
ncbi:GIY-YIG nuclease family protein [Desulfoluna spongiiphila]|nr:GIY-YIG nuclease family protein [Desulfoluna spongiiphila]